MATVVESYHMGVSLYLLSHVLTRGQLREDAELNSPGVSSPGLSPSDLLISDIERSRLEEVSTCVTEVIPVYLVAGATGGDLYREPDGLVLIVDGGRLSIESTKIPVGYQTVLKMVGPDGTVQAESTVNSTVPLATQYAAAAGVRFEGNSPAPPYDSAESAVATDAPYRLRPEQRNALLSLLVTLLTGADDKKGLLGVFAEMVAPLAPLSDIALGL